MVTFINTSHTVYVQLLSSGSLITEGVAFRFTVQHPYACGKLYQYTVSGTYDSDNQVWVINVPVNYLNIAGSYNLHCLVVNADDVQEIVFRNALCVDDPSVPDHSIQALAGLESVVASSSRSTLTGTLSVDALPN